MGNYKVFRKKNKLHVEINPQSYYIINEEALL